MRPKFKIMAKKKKTTKTEYEYKNGDNISEVARKLTGNSYMVYALLEYNHLRMEEVKPGTILKWR